MIDTIDSHAHLFPHWFKNRTDRVAQAAKDQGIAVINSAISPDHYTFGRKFARRHDNVFLTLGIAPQWIIKYKLDYKAALDQIAHFSDEIVAIGEVGLDYHWVKDQRGRQIQRKAFIQAIAKANELSLPIVIHSRKADEDCLNLLEKKAQVDVIFHCFSGTVSHAVQVVEKGWYISIPTAVTQRTVHRRLAEAVPLENLIVETDSPFLSPDPKQRQNQPVSITRAIEEVAQLKGITYDEVREATFRNCEQLFALSF